MDVENSHNYAFWSADSFSEDQVLADYDHENGQLAGRNRSGGWSCGSVLPWTFIGAERLFDLSSVGWRLLPAGEWHAETWQVGDVLTLGVIGSAHPVTVALYHNGNVVLSWTSSSQAEVKNGGSPGIGIYSPSGEALTLDNWEGGNLGPDTQPPSVPGNLVATAIGVSQVHLSWTASTDDVGVTGYLVERQDPGSPSFVQVGTTHRDELQRHRIGCGEQLQLSGPGNGCRTEPERLFGRWRARRRWRVLRPVMILTGQMGG